MALPTQRQNDKFLQQGTQLNGMFEVDEPIAAGGMGEVYRGHSIQTHDPVAIKVIKADFAEHETAMQLFRKEASALHSLQNEAIVRYYTFAVDPVLQRAYLAMEFVEGDSLAKAAKQAPLPVDAVLLLARRLALGFQAAHERGIIHRDVSPDNIILPQNDVRLAKIIDFGIARSTAKNAQTVIGGGFAGKQNYVSPEQLGLFNGDVNAQSDIYSLALVLVEALRGSPMDMGGSQLDIIEKRRTVPNLAFIDPRIRPLIEKMLQPDPADRPASMLAVANWQEAALPGAAAWPSRPQASASAAQIQAGRAAPLRQAQGRSRGGLYAVLALLLLAGGGGAAYVAFGPKQPGPRLVDVPVVPILIPSKNEEQVAATEPQVPPLSPPVEGTGSTTPVKNTEAAVEPPSVVIDPPPIKPPPREPPVIIAGLPPGKVLPTNPAGPYEVPPEILRPIDLHAIEAMTRFVRDNGTGDCLASLPMNLTQTAALVESFAQKAAPFKTLNDSFKTAFGFEPEITAWFLSENQCPFATFLAKTKIEPAAGVKITLGNERLRSGQYLTGTVDTPTGKNVEVLYMEDDGTVQNITNLVRTAGPKAFNLKVDRNPVAGEKPGEKPQMLIAIVSAVALTSLRTPQPVAAARFFPALATEIATKGQTIGLSVKGFNLE